MGIMLNRSTPPPALTAYSRRFISLVRANPLREHTTEETAAPTITPISRQVTTFDVDVLMLHGYQRPSRRKVKQMQSIREWCILDGSHCLADKVERIHFA